MPLNPKKPGVTYTSSGHYWMICDRCGFKVRNDHMQTEWTGLQVCDETVNGCYEDRHPQDFVRAVPDYQVVSPARPYDPEHYPYATMNPPFLGFSQAIAGYAVCGTATCGAYYPDQPQHPES